MRKRTPDLRKLAQRQRWMIGLILLVFALQTSPRFILSYTRGTGLPPEGVLWGLLFLFICAYFLLIVGVVLLLTAEGNSIIVIVLCAIVMVAPCVNMLLLLLVNMSVTRTLRRAGVHVGLLGAKDEEVARLLDPMLCKQCGYNLTGNVSGICPECGRPLERGQA